MKESSIEWLEQRIKEMFLPLSQEETLLKDIQQAKEMHKQEIIDAFSWNVYGNDYTKDGIYYYKNTYEKEN